MLPKIALPLLALALTGAVTALVAATPDPRHASMLCGEGTGGSASTLCGDEGSGGNAWTLCGEETGGSASTLCGGGDDDDDTSLAP